LERNALYAHTQSLFRKGLVTLVGSGASCAKGLPTMGRLAEEVLLRVDSVLKDGDFDEEVHAEWKKIAVALEDGEGLEQAIHAESMPDELGALIAVHASECVREDEAVAIDAMSRSDKPGEFSRIARHLSRVDGQPTIITTNYDRLIEVDLALSGVAVDSMFAGHTIGRLDEKLARQEHEYVERTASSRSRSRSLTRPHVQLAKPHGSLDWFTSGSGDVVRSDLTLAGPRRVVAPGGSKYRLGYESPFDVHRERANRAIDRAGAFLIVGYGFNDDHLQTHLKPAFANVPSLVVSYALTENARAFLSTNPDAVGIERGPTDDLSVVMHEGNQKIVNCGIWKLDVLLREALQV
jgi:hypothetical protein